MIFDKNQQNFPSDFCREVWWWAIGIVPPEVSLTDEVKEKCTPDILEGCHQWHAYFSELCADMYRNEAAYNLASPRQYRDILEKIADMGPPQGDCIEVNPDEWQEYAKKINRSKAYTTQGITLEGNLNTLGRMGLEFDGKAFTHAKYPKIFHAMHQFRQTPNVRETPARHQFAHCDFRRLFKNYAENYDELLRRASDESVRVAHAIHDHCKAQKIQRYIHFGIIKYKHKKTRVLDFSLHIDQFPTLRVNIGSSIDMTQKIHMMGDEESVEQILELISARKIAIDRSIL